MTVKTARPLKVVIPGGRGQLGGILANHFHSQGHQVTVLTRTPKTAPWRVLAWNGKDADRWAEELDGSDVVLNLAGRSVDCRYNSVNRREILESRILSTQILGEVIAKVAGPPRLWINASTATIYRHAVDREMDEATGEIGGKEANVPSAWRFSIDVATRWEQTFFQAKTPNTRKIALRSAMVMSTRGGGAFETLLRLVRLGLGGAAGTGEQFMSWVHESDFVRAVEFLIANSEIEGVVNVAAPFPSRNRDFMLTLRKAWGKGFALALPDWLLEFGAIFLRTETELLLKSRRVIPWRLTQCGFRFEFPRWREAARELVSRWRKERNNTSTGTVEWKTAESVR